MLLALLYLLLIAIALLLLFIGFLVYSALYRPDVRIPHNDRVHWRIKLFQLTALVSLYMKTWESKRNYRHFMMNFVKHDKVYKVRDMHVPSLSPSINVPIRIYWPLLASTTEALPMIVFYHGGGWCIGSVKTYDAMCRKLSNETGCVVISVDYRLAPEYPFPAGFEDCYGATKWLYDNASSIRGDRTRMIVMGDSAGANLATALTIENHKRNEADFKIKHQVLVYPSTNNTGTAKGGSLDKYEHAYILPRTAMNVFFHLYTGSSKDVTEDPRCSPYLYQGDLRGLPGAHIITAEFDPLKDDGELFFKKLKDAGVKVSLQNYEDVHGFFGFTGAFQETPQTRQAMKDISSHIRKVQSTAI